LSKVLLTGSFGRTEVRFAGWELCLEHLLEEIGILSGNRLSVRTSPAPADSYGSLAIEIVPRYFKLRPRDQYLRGKAMNPAPSSGRAIGLTSIPIGCRDRPDQDVRVDREKADAPLHWHDFGGLAPTISGHAVFDNIVTRNP